MPNPTEPSHWSLFVYLVILPRVWGRLGMVGQVHARNPSTLEWKQANHKDRVFLSCPQSSRPAWDRGDPVCMGRECMNRKIKDSNSAGWSVFQPCLLSQLVGAGLSKLLHPGVSVLPQETHLSGIFFPIYKYRLLPAPDLELPG